MSGIKVPITSKILWPELKKEWDEHYSDDPEIKEKLEHIRQEAHYHHTLLDFGEVLRQYGVEKVLKDLDEDSYWILEKWFIKGEVTK